MFNDCKFKQMLGAFEWKNKYGLSLCWFFGVGGEGGGNNSYEKGNLYPALVQKIAVDETTLLICL